MKIFAKMFKGLFGRRSSAVKASSPAEALNGKSIRIDIEDVQKVATARHRVRRLYEPDNGQTNHQRHVTRRAAGLHNC